jgi:hypothetical protein
MAPGRLEKIVTSGQTMLNARHGLEVTILIK